MLLVSGAGTIKKRIRQIQQNSYTNVKLVGVVPLGSEESVQEIYSVPVLGTRPEELLEYARTHIVDEVMVDLRQDEEKDLVDQLLNMGVTVHLCVDRLAGNCPNPTVEMINGIQCITSTVHTITPLESFLKRLMDIVGGLIGCLLTAVIFVFVAPIIKLQAPGPVFFAQTRMGKNGRTFKLYKFRSMYVDAEERKAALMAQNKMSGLMFKMDNDPRIYPFGHFLRNTSLDEFPQFWNILKGDMSLVGTRPPTLDEYSQYEYHHKSRLAAKPGLTGMWQVSGRSDITDFEEVVRLDKEYIQNWSLGLDIELLFKTIGVVVRRKGSV